MVTVLRWVSVGLLVLASACSAGTGSDQDWPPPPAGILADCHSRGDVCGGSGYCGPSPDDRLVCCSQPLEPDGYCRATDLAADAGTGQTCSVDADCPAVDDCHVNRCRSTDHVCVPKVAKARTPCGGGTALCNPVGICVPKCSKASDCPAATVECQTPTCDPDGFCRYPVSEPGDPCQFGPGACGYADGSNLLVCTP